MAFIDMLHIEKNYGLVAVLQDVSLSMERGEVVSIIGPSGSGKSTFLRCLGYSGEHRGGSICRERRTATHLAKNGYGIPIF